MKRLLIFAALAILLVPLVSAGESYDISFEDTPTHAVFLYPGDEVRFDMLGDTHSIILESIGLDRTTAKLDIVPFLSDDVTIVRPGLVTLDTITRVDLDGFDGENDLNIALYSIAEDGQAHLVLQQITDTNTNEVTGDIGLVDDEIEEDSKPNYLLIGIFAAILLLVLFLFARNKATRQSTTETPETKPEEELKEQEQEKITEETESYQTEEPEPV